MRLTFVFVLLIFNYVFSQRDVTSEIIGTPYIGIHYGFNLTGKDLADRYGLINHLGGICGYKTKKNWIFSSTGNFLFGNQIRIEGILDNLKDEQGTITNSSGSPATVLLFLRGFNLDAQIGKIIPIWSPNANSGIMINAGFGYILHKLRIETQQDEVPQIEGENLKGYDRLTIGLNCAQFLGYSFMANMGVYNFYAGFYFQESFTKDQRAIFWDHPNELVSDNIRYEIQYGLKIGWLIPIYKRQPKQYYFD